MRKGERYAAYAARAKRDIAECIDARPELFGASQGEDV